MTEQMMVLILTGIFAAAGVSIVAFLRCIPLGTWVLMILAGILLYTVGFTSLCIVVPICMGIAVTITLLQK